MCEWMSIAATVVFAVLAFRARRAGSPSAALETTAFTFLGASLMWGVDCVHAFRAGEGLFDVSASDAALGLLVVLAGLALFSVLRFRELRRAARAAAL